jgi:anti-sigma-K factor RskA
MSEAVSRDDMMELVALYALGVLPRQESALVAAFLAGDDAARAEYLALRAAADALALSADEPVDSARSARMKERLMARVRNEPASGALARRRIAPNAGWLWAAGVATAASLLFATVTGVQVVTLRGQLTQSEQRATSLSTQVAQGSRVALRDRQMLTDLVSPDAKRYDIAEGSVIVRGDRMYFALSKLPALPKGKVYQAWTLPKGAKAMQPSLTFSPNPDGVAVVALPVDASKVGAVAVSVEPEGGSKQPTTTPTFVRTVS